jgi:hypothetical protein
MSTTHSEFVLLALVILHEKHMRCIIFSSVAFWVYHIFTDYLINGAILGKKLLGIKSLF